MTLLGKIDLNRLVLRPKSVKDAQTLHQLSGDKTVVPLDEHLGLDKSPFKISIGAMLKIAHHVQKSDSYDDAAASLKQQTRIDTNPETIRNVANYIGKIVLDNDLKRAETTFNLFQSGKLILPAGDDKHDLYMECYGATFHAREKDEQGHAWNEIKLGAVFGGNNLHWRFNEKTGKREKKIGLREYTAYAGPVETFQKLLFDCAVRRGYGRCDNAILLTDGTILIENMKESLFPDAIHILDFFHLSENVRRFAKEMFRDDEEKYKTWAKDICKRLRESDSCNVIKELKSIDKNTLKKCKFNLLDYIEKNSNSIDYATYEKNDWYIGSDAIEGGDKTALQERLKLSGMRWNIESARYIMALMTKVKSLLWDTDVVDAVYNHLGVTSTKYLDVF
ncbi:MAG: hypothetical protein LBT62_02000 [Deltaproteobacteria bacterium]|nr:hypothetical protein [Deltaproteobacteria bacterium]